MASARRILCAGRVVTRHGVSTRRLYQLGTLRSWSQPLFLVPSKPWKFWCDQWLTHITIWHYRVSNGVTPIARWFMMENPSINGWFGGTPYDLWNDDGLSEGKSEDNGHLPELTLKPLAAAMGNPRKVIVQPAGDGWPWFFGASPILRQTICLSHCWLYIFSIYIYI